MTFVHRLADDVDVMTCRVITLGRRVEDDHALCTSASDGPHPDAVHLCRITEGKRPRGLNEDTK